MSGVISYQETAQRTLDLSGLPPAMAHESARRLALMLKEVLDRIEIPPIESIPDAEMMTKLEFKRWTLPNSEIQLRRIETGPRSGEYLFTADTLLRLPEFYLKVEELPYKPNASEGWYESTLHSPIGVAMLLRNIIPPRWLVHFTKDAHWNTYLEQPVWRWLGVFAVLGLGGGFVVKCFRLKRQWASRMAVSSIKRHWLDLICPLSLVIAAELAVFVVAEVLRVSGAVYLVLTLSLEGVFYVALTWLVWVAGDVLAASLIDWEELLPSSIDSQLIRLVTRLLTIIATVSIIVIGADHLGLPAYSVLAGLGVGGLAVALAAQQTLANLLGSLIIMFEKPFAVGHWIKVKDAEGVVENVGFRSTRIRTHHNSLVTIPSSQLVNSTIDNMELREYRQIKTLLNLKYDTPPAKVEAFVAGVKHILETHPKTRKDKLQVFFYDFNTSSLDVLLSFFIKAPNRLGELEQRQGIFLDILRLAEAQEVGFAFPTQTLHIESLPKDGLTPKTFDPASSDATSAIGQNHTETPTP